MCDSRSERRSRHDVYRKHLPEVPQKACHQDDLFENQESSKEWKTGTPMVRVRQAPMAFFEPAGMDKLVQSPSAWCPEARVGGNAHRGIPTEITSRIHDRVESVQMKTRNNNRTLHMIS